MHVMQKVITLWHARSFLPPKRSGQFFFYRNTGGKQHQMEAAIFISRSGNIDKS
jgi:hypothetical protein